MLTCTSWQVSVTFIYICSLFVFFFFKQKTAYEMRISDWSSDVCSSDLWDLATVIMLFASILLAGSLRGNPALVDPAGGMKAPDRPIGVLAITRHPMMWAFMIWAAVHVILWGSAANLILSSGIMVLALVGSIGQEVKKRRLLGPDRS